MTQKVVFSFDKISLNNLEKLKNNGNFTTLADALKDAILISRGFQNQYDQGFTQVIVRNPVTGQERLAVFSNLMRR